MTNTYTESVCVNLLRGVMSFLTCQSFTLNYSKKEVSYFFYPVHIWSLSFIHDFIKATFDEALKSQFYGLALELTQSFSCGGY